MTHGDAGARAAESEDAGPAAAAAARRWLVGVATVLGTLGIWAIGLVDAPLRVRIVGGAVGVAAAIVALWCSRRRRNLAGWFLVAVWVVVLRVLFR